MASAARWRQKKKRVQAYPAAKTPSRRLGGGLAVGRGGRWGAPSRPVARSKRCTASLGQGNWAGGTPAPPHPVCVVGRGGVLWRCRGLWRWLTQSVATSPQTGPFCAPPAASTGFIPTPAPPSPTGGLTGRFCGYIGTPSPPPPPPTHRGHQKSTPCAPIWTPNAQICLIFPRSTAHTDPARRGGAAPCFRCGYAVLEGGRSRATLDTIDTLDMGVREWTERT